MRRLVPLALFLAAAVPRLWELDAVTTIDEPLWMERSAAFVEAIRTGDVHSTIQSGHPGVTTLWLAGGSQWLGERLTAQRSSLAALTDDPLVWSRGAIALVSSLAIPLVYLLMRSWLSLPGALLATLLVAWNPLFVGLSRVVHVDALLASLALVSVLAYLRFLDSSRRRLLVGSAVAGALAILTRFTAIVLVPWVWALSLAWAAAWPGADGRRLRTLRRAMVAAGAWCLVLTLALPLAWPALAISPATILSLLAGRAVLHATVSHAAAGYLPDPTYYVEALGLYLGSPAFVMLLLGGSLWARRIWTARPRSEPAAPALVPRLTPVAERRHALLAERPLRAALALTLFALLLLGAMTVGGTRSPRYGLAAYLAMTLAATLVLDESLPPGRDLLRKGLFAALAGAQLLGLVLAHPHYLAAHNVLWPAKADAGVRWGEGLELAAGELARLPASAGVVVSSWYPDVVARQLPGRVVPPEQLAAEDVDYAVAYAWRFGPPAFPELGTDYYDRVVPTRTFSIYGQDYVWLLPSPARLELLRAGLAQAAASGEIVAVPPTLTPLAELEIAAPRLRAPQGPLGGGAAELAWLRSVGAEILVQPMPEAFWQLPGEAPDLLEPVASYTTLPRLDALLATMGHAGLRGQRLPVGLERSDAWQVRHLAGSGGSVKAEGGSVVIRVDAPARETEIVHVTRAPLPAALIVDVELDAQESEQRDGAAAGLYLLRADGSPGARDESVFLGWAHREEPLGRGVLLVRGDGPDRERVVDDVGFPERLRLVLYRGELLGLLQVDGQWRTVGRLDLAGWERVQVGVGARSWITRPALEPRFSALTVWRTIEPVPKGVLLYRLAP